LIDEAKKIDPNFDPARFEAHHGIPLNAYPRLDVLRQQLAAWDIDLNDASINGVLLPKGTNAEGTTGHGDTQSNPNYWREILDRFKGVETAARAIEVMKEVRTDLQNGNFVEPKNPRTGP
jgi:A nuclease family of the HNH/ENDO VII superfamily with conserved AHH